MNEIEAVCAELQVVRAELERVTGAAIKASREAAEKIASLEAQLMRAGVRFILDTPSDSPLTVSAEAPVQQTPCLRWRVVGCGQTIDMIDRQHAVRTQYTNKALHGREYERQWSADGGATWTTETATSGEAPVQKTPEGKS